MKFILILLLLISTKSYALTIENPDGVFHECTEVYNFLSSPTSIPPESIVCRASLGQETPDTKLFNDDMTGVTFVEGNLDNVFIPDGNTVIGASQKRFKVQEDGFDWLIDAEGKPIERI